MGSKPRLMGSQPRPMGGYPHSYVIEWHVNSHNNKYDDIKHAIVRAMTNTSSAEIKNIKNSKALVRISHILFCDPSNNAC